MPTLPPLLKIASSLSFLALLGASSLQAAPLPTTNFYANPTYQSVPVQLQSGRSVTITKPYASAPTYAPAASTSYPAPVYVQVQGYAAPPTYAPAPTYLPAQQPVYVSQPPVQTEVVYVQPPAPQVVYVQEPVRYSPPVYTRPRRSVNINLGAGFGWGRGWGWGRGRRGRGRGFGGRRGRRGRVCF